jgi:site-specific recombinase XerD
MSLDHLPSRLSQAQTLSDLDHLLDDKTLKGILNQLVFFCVESNYSPRTIENLENIINKFLEWLGKTVTMPEQLQPRHVSLYLMVRKKEEGWKDSTVNDHYRAIHRFCSYMVEKAILKTSPMQGMKPPKIPQEVLIPYTREQIQSMLYLCDHSGHFTGIRNKAMILIYLSSGLRKKEMSKIQLQDVNIVQCTIKVMGKGSKGRIVGFGKSAKSALMEYSKVRKERAIEGNTYLWITEEGKPLGYWGTGLAIYNLKIRAGINVKSSTHALRHSFATQSLRNNASLKHVQSLMGHSTPTMTLRYAKTVDSEDAVKQHKSFDPVDNWKI